MLARFKPEAFEQNAKLVEAVEKFAQRKGMTSAQVAIAWVVYQGAIPIPGSSKIEKPAQLPSTGANSVEETSLDLDTQDLRATPKIMLGSTLTPFQYTMSNVIVSFSNLSRYEIENLLDRYKTLMAPHMPFVSEQALPTTASSSTSPVVSKAIVAVAHSHDTPTQKILVEELVQHITSKIFTNAEKSLEILQALLILCTWYNPHIFTSSSHTSLLHLCMALTTDLAIDRDAMSCEMAHMAAAMESCGIPQPVKNVSDEERRAVLGVFWLANTVFTSFRKIDVPTWTPWLQQCLDTLKRSEQESDRVLVGLVQSQKIMHQAMSPSLLRLPEALQTELDDINPAAIKTTGDLTHTLLSLQHSCAAIAIWSPSFPTHNLSGIWSCISHLTHYLTLYASLPVSSYPMLPFTVFAQFAFVFVVMVRASSTHFDGFNGTLLRELVDFETVMEQASEKYEAVARLEVDGVRVKNGGFAEWAVKCRWAKTYYGMRAKEMASKAAEGRSAHRYGDSTRVDGLPGESEWVGGEEFSIDF